MVLPWGAPRAWGLGASPAHPLVSHSPSVCSWRDLKTMICFYLVLFYTTLIMLSRQVRRGGPPHPGPGQRPVPHVERERGGARLPRGAAQKTAGRPVSLGRLPSGPGRHPAPRRTRVSRLLSLGGTTRAPQPWSDPHAAAPADRLLLPPGLSVEEQVQEGARGVRDHGEREPPPPGERPAGPRGRPLHRRQVE